MADLKAYQAKKRGVVKGTYRGYDIIGMPPPSSGGMAVVQMLNVLEGYDLKANGYGSAKNIHLTAEAMRRAFADRARYLADPDFEKDIPLPMLISKDYAATLAQDDQPEQGLEVDRRQRSSSPTRSPETTHLSIVDAKRNAVALTYTLESGYGSTHRRAGRRLPAEQRNGRLQRRARPHRRARHDRHARQPRAARQAHAVEHVADDHRQGRPAVHGHRHARAAAPSSTPC